jgi:predicted RNA-binding Zn-ribbon protein involved in translation (DUF1610 family)
MSNNQWPGGIALTANKCPLCGDYHPADEGIILFIRNFICPNCGTEWRDLWCADCNDHCPSCDAEIEPQPEDWDRMVYEQPVHGPKT